MKEQGEERGPERLEASLYRDLREIAAVRMAAERAGHTLQATALVHEVWLRLRRTAGSRSMDERRLRILAAKALQRVLIDHARQRAAQKRDGGARLDLERLSVVVSTGEQYEYTALHSALQRLRRRSPRQARVVESRFFAGLSVTDTAAALGVSADTVKREWRMARAWLHRELEREGGAA